jgi:hypothetical protein
MENSLFLDSWEFPLEQSQKSHMIQPSVMDKYISDCGGLNEIAQLIDIQLLPKYHKQPLLDALIGCYQSD